MPVLKVISGPKQWQTYKVTGPRFTIGRREHCNLIIKDSWVSREHTVLIERSTGEFIVQDLQSENGSFLNGHRISEAHLKHKDILRIGRTELCFLTLDMDSVDDAVLTPLSIPIVVEGEAEADESSGMTVASGATVRKAPDLRNRVRGLEKQLLQKEQDVARLAAENSVIKRALAQAGMLDAKGTPDFVRMATPSPTLLAHPAVVRQTANPLARIIWPLAQGGFLAREDLQQSRDVAQGVVRMNVLGLGRQGARLASAFHKLGYHHTLALCPADDLPDGCSLPPTAQVSVCVPDDEVLPGAGSRALVAARPALAAAFRASLWDRPDLQLVTCGAQDVLGAAAMGGLVDLLDEYESLVAGREGDSALPKAVLAWVGEEPPGRAEEAPQAGLAALKLLFQSWRLKLVLLVEEARVARLFEPDGASEGMLAVDLVCGLLDAANRLPLMDPLGGDLQGDHARRLLLEGGITTLGLGATSTADEESLQLALRFTLNEGLLSSSVPALAREGMLLVMIGKDVLETGSGVLLRLASVCEELKDWLPQARVATGFFVDDQAGVRFLACLGGLPFPNGESQAPKKG